MENVWLEIITQGIYGIIVFVLGYMWNKSRSLASIQKNMENGIGLLLKDKLRQYHERAMNRGSITYEEEATAEEIYKVYHALGLNGQGTAMINDLRKLPKAGVKIGG